MNEYIIQDITLKRAFNRHNPALAKLVSILYPENPGYSFDRPIDCTEINDKIESYLKNKLGQNTADLCLDHFAEMFGGDVIDRDKSTIRQTIHEIVRNKETVRQNIEAKYKK